MIAKSCAWERLEARRLGAGLPRLFALEILPVIDSTNRYLWDKGRSGAPSGYACFAERQTAGRGRQGRTWLSPEGNLCFSLLWRFPRELSLEGLSLAAGVAIAQAIRETGARGIALKWPNDVLGEGRKLAGILVEVGDGFAVIGVGINVHLPRNMGRHIDRPWTDVHALLGRAVSRNRLGRAALRRLLEAAARFEKEGLRPFLGSWSRLDALQGRPVVLSLGTTLHGGVARGIDGRGRLLLEQGGRLCAFGSGEAHVVEGA